jgi:hypothetical protein
MLALTLLRVQFVVFKRAIQGSTKNNSTIIDQCRDMRVPVYLEILFYTLWKTADPIQERDFG